LTAPELIQPVVSTPTSINTEKRKRRDQFVRQTVSNSKADDLVENGWQLDKKLSTRTRVKRAYSVQEELENRVWVLLADLGFPELSVGSEFSINLQKGRGEPVRKHVSVFAKDDETVVIAQCIATPEIKRKSLKPLIEELSSSKSAFATAIRRHYGGGFKPKIVWTVVTDKIIWSKQDRELAAKNNIAVITERELRYFNEFARHIGPAGRYQFLAHFLEGQRVPSLENQVVPAIRGKLGGRTFYAFVTTPARLLKISFVNHRTLNDPKGIPTYQRLISKKRIRDIHTFLSDGGFFPTNIIVNFVGRPRYEIKAKDEDASVHFGNLYLPDKYKSAWVIDGQHRLYGFTRQQDLQKSENIFVLAFQQMSHEDEANLFVTINHEQKTVPRTLLADLQGELKWGSENPRERIQAMCARLVNVLNAELGGPFHTRIVQTGLRGNRETCLTLPMLVDGLKRSNLLGTVHKKLKSYHPGPFSGKDDFVTLDRARHTLEDIFSLVREANTDLWRAGADGGVCTNTSISAMLMILSEAIQHYERKTKLDTKELEPEEIALFLQDYLQPVIKLLKKSSDQEIVRFFKEDVPYGSRGPRELFLKLVGLVRTEVTDFGPADFDEWRAEQNQERAKNAAEKIQELNAAICATIFDKFHSVYGNDEYFDKGVSDKKMRLNAFEKMQDDEFSQRGRIEEYLNLIEYKKIVEKKDNWPLFASIFSIQMPSEDKGQAKYLKWLTDLNSIRKKTTHKSVGRPLSESDLEFIDWIHEEFFERLTANPISQNKEAS